MKISSAERLWRCKLKVSSSVFCSLKNTLKSAQINLFRKTFYVKYPGHFIIVHFNLRNIFHANQGYFKCLWAVFGCAFFISTDEDLAIQIKGMILKKKYKIDGNEYENHKKNVKKTICTSPHLSNHMSAVLSFIHYWCNFHVDSFVRPFISAVTFDRGHFLYMYHWQYV